MSILSITVTFLKGRTPLGIKGSEGCLARPKIYFFHLKWPVTVWLFESDRGQGASVFSQTMESDWLRFESYFCHKLTVSSWTYHLTNLRVALISKVGVIISPSQSCHEDEMR